MSWLCKCCDDHPNYDSSKFCRNCGMPKGYRLSDTPTAPNEYGTEAQRARQFGKDTAAELLSNYVGDEASKLKAFMAGFNSQLSTEQVPSRLQQKAPLHGITTRPTAKSSARRWWDIIIGRDRRREP